MNAVTETAALAAGASENGLTPLEIFHRIGELTRNLHDALRELKCDTGLADAVHELPDARQRLDYIATLTGKAAERVLAGVERGKAQQERLRLEGTGLGARWERHYRYGLPAEQLGALTAETRAFFAALPEHTGEMDRELTEIMMAQDFHDLTGQVIQRVGKLAASLEERLLRLLIETAPPEKRREVAEVRAPAGPSGPVINPQGRNDVVTNQAQVDDLLASLGF